LPSGREPKKLRFPSPSERACGHPFSAKAFFTMRQTPSAPQAAFTLIELLVVVAIISILASIAVPHYLEAQIRAKVARALADMRTLETAIAAYRTDHEDLPPRNADIADSSLGISVSPSFYPCYQNRYKQLSVITTPVGYLATIPEDVFETRIKSPNNIFDYLDEIGTRELIAAARLINPANLNSQGFVLISVGPDGFFGHAAPLYGSSFCPESYPAPPSGSGIVTTYNLVYDPTNGTKSHGNIYRFSGWPSRQSTLGFNH
jgi:prepilin-type N-terminal cleavage/methylation domain-containing protein